MKPTIQQKHRSRRGGFTLVEVTLALGIVTFALVAILGVLPTALATGRQSLIEARCAAVADTLFASFRCQNFTQVCYVDSQLNSDGMTPSGSGPAALNLATLTSTSPTVQLYASFVETCTDAPVTSDTVGDARRIYFSQTAPTSGVYYPVTLRFNNQPDGATSPTSGGVNRIEVDINAGDRPKDVYRFISTVANRTN